MTYKIKRFFCMLLFVLLLLPRLGLADAAEIYESAENLLAEKEYADAAETFDSIVSYKDAAKCGMYARALEALHAGRTEEAKVVFAYLGSFRDCEMLGYFMDVLEMEKDGKYLEAIDACKVLPYSYYGRIREKAAELKEKHEYHGYTSAYFVGDYLIVRHAQTELSGVIDMRGRILIPCEWDTLFGGKDGYFCAGEQQESGYRYGVVSAWTGEATVPCEWDSISFVGNGCAVVRKGEVFDGLCGLISVENGEMLLPCEYEYIRESGSFVVCSKDVGDEKLYHVYDCADRTLVSESAAYPETADGVTVGVDADGRLHLFEGSAAQYPQTDTEGLELLDSFVMQSDDGQTGRLLTHDGGKRVTYTFALEESSFVYHELPAKTDAAMTVSQEDGLYGIQDKTSGEMAVPFEWDHLVLLSGKTALGFKGEVYYSKPQEGESYVIDLVSGTESPVDWMYTNWEYGIVPPAGLYMVTDGEKYGVINASGHPVIPCIMSDIDLLESGYLRVRNGSYQFGIRNLSGEEVIPCQYRWVDYENGRFALVSGGLKYTDKEEAYLTIIDEAGNTLF